MRKLEKRLGIARCDAPADLTGEAQIGKGQRSDEFLAPDKETAAQSYNNAIVSLTLHSVELAPPSRGSDQCLVEPEVWLVVERLERILEPSESLKVGVHARLSRYKSLEKTGLHLILKL